MVYFYSAAARAGQNHYSSVALACYTDVNWNELILQRVPGPVISKTVIGSEKFAATIQFSIYFKVMF